LQANVKAMESYDQGNRVKKSSTNR